MTPPYGPFHIQQPNSKWATQQIPKVQPNIIFVPFALPPQIPPQLPAGPPYVSPTAARPREDKPDDLYYHIAASQGQTITFDLRSDPRTSPSPDMARCGTRSVFRHPVKSIRLVCRDFPWVIEVHDPYMVTCAKVWERMYVALQEHITDSEWALASEQKKLHVEEAMRRRKGQIGEGHIPRRIDWLGNDTIFGGLEKDEAFAKGAVMLGRTKCDTLTIKLRGRI